MIDVINDNFFSFIFLQNELNSFFNFSTLFIYQFPFETQKEKRNKQYFDIY